MGVSPIHPSEKGLLPCHQRYVSALKSLARVFLWHLKLQVESGQASFLLDLK